MEEPGVGVAGRTKAAPAMKNLQVASRGCSRTELRVARMEEQVWVLRWELRLRRDEEPSGGVWGCSCSATWFKIWYK
ncbi:hypothetical protein FCV25MIE_29274 [Fagus crenata]